MPRLYFALLLGLLVADAATAQRAARPAVPEPTFPPVTRPWTLADVREAAVVLHRMAQEQPEALPHYSVGSRSLFGRLTSPGVLAPRPELSAEERLMHHDRAVRLYEQVFLLYARQQAQRSGYDIEVAELAGLLLQATAHVAEDLEAARAQQPDTSRAAFDEAAAALAADMARTMIGVLEMSADADALTSDARQRLLLHASRTAAPIVRVLSPGQRAEVIARIDALLQREASDELKAHLQALRTGFSS